MIDRNIFTQRRTSAAANVLLAVVVGILLAMLMLYWGLCDVC